MAIMKGSNKYQYDAALALRPYGEAEVTANTNTDAFDLGGLFAYWNQDLAGAGNEVAAHQLAVVVDVLATAGDAPVFTVEVDEEAFADPDATFSLTAPGTGKFVFLLDVDTLRRFNTDATHLRVAAEVGDSLTFAVYVAPIHPYA